MLDSQKTSKIGLDDYLLKSGERGIDSLIENAILPLCSNDEQILGFLNTEIRKIGEKKNPSTVLEKIYPALSTRQGADFKFLLAEVKAITSIPIVDLKKDIKRVQKSIPRKPNNTNSEYQMIEWGPETPIKIRIEKIKNSLIEDNRLFRMGNDLICANPTEKIIVDHKRIAAVFHEKTEIKFVVPDKDKNSFIMLPPDHARAFLFKPDTLSEFREIILYTNNATYSKDWRLLEPGYSARERVYYSGKKVYPMLDKEILSDVLDDFSFRNEASKVNFLATLITTVLRQKCLGKKPLFGFTGNQPGLGKTWAVEMISIVADGVPGKPINYDSDETEFEKKIGASISNTDVLFIDNVKLSTSRPVESAALEKLITAETVSFRRLGTSTNIERPNTIMTCITMNHAKFGKDILARILPIEFYYPEDKDPRERKFRIQDLKSYVVNNRDRLIASICGLVENWISQGKPLANAEFRFNTWAQEIGGILEANGYSGFLDNLGEATQSYESEAQAIGLLFSDILGTPVTTKDLDPLARNLRQLEYIFNSPNPRIVLGKLLKRYNQRSIPLPDGLQGKLIINEDKHLKQKTYTVSPHYPHHPQENKGAGNAGSGGEQLGVENKGAVSLEWD